jgi:hypothetical protein
MILLSLVVIPTLGGLLAWLLGRWGAAWSRAVALVATVVEGSDRALWEVRRRRLVNGR